MSAADRRAPRAASAILLALATIAASCSGPAGPVDGEKAMAHVRAMVAFGPRPFGSAALAKTTDYLEAELRRLGLSPRRHEVLHEKEQKTIRNLYVQIDGQDPEKGPVLVIGAHYDTKLAAGHADAAHNFPFVGAIDGGGGPAVLLELARVLVQEPARRPQCNVWLYWIDAEESLDWIWNDERALLGSKAFCRMLSETKQLARIKAFVLLDLIGSKDWKIDKDGNSEPRLQELFLRAAKAMGAGDRVQKFPTPQEIEAYKAAARQQGKPENWGITDDHIVFTRYGVPSVLLIDFERRIPGRQQVNPKTDFQQWWHTPDDDLEAMDPRALAFAGNLVLQALPELDAFVLGRR